MNDSDSSKDGASLPTVSSQQGGVYRIAHKTSFGGARIFILKCLWPLLPFTGFFAFATLVRIITGVPLSFFDIAGGSLSLLFLSSYFVLLACVWKREFILRQWGLTLPFIYFWSASGRLDWSWSKLIGVVFSRSRPQLASADQIVFRFEHLHSSKVADVHIKLTEIDHLDLKKLIYAIVSNASHAQIEPPLDVVALEFPTVSGIKHLNFHNFTSLWDEEFSTRYSPTLFVPLSREDELKDGAIKISELVACGGSAAIYAARSRNGDQIIVKEAVIPKNANEELKAKAIELFNREALLLSRLDHRNIAKVLDHFVENEHHVSIRPGQVMV
ncbi:MAG: hypothetical protein K8F91_22090 [Candidatus Obscuribacterales bacterium]|nr:hypothetical protein [Candidatus Obscuribacterales bacterium]